MVNTIEAPSGYAQTDDYFATESTQGVLHMVSLSLTWQQIVSLVVPPDPGRKSDYNRPLYVPHAKRFGQYVDISEDPFTPPITAFTDPANVTLESLGSDTLDQYGLKIAKIARGSSVFLLDGQHRVYGIKLLFDEWRTKLDREKQILQRAKAGADRDRAKQHEAMVKKLKGKLSRLDKMQITVQILLTGEGDQARRIFTDVADNAKGISRSQLADFSDRSVFNRVAREISSSLLQGVVDPVHDRMSTQNPHWLSLKDVVNVAQAVEFPIGKRWTAKRELELQHREVAIENTTRAYFEALIEVFPDIGAIINGELSATELRPGGSSPSLLGSATMIRVLGAAYKRLRNGERDDADGWVQKPLTHAGIVQAWEETLPSMTAGHVPDPSGDRDKAMPLVDDRWLSTGVFVHPFYAPGANQGQMNSLVDAITEWTREATVV